jgi:Zn-dependent metalloprotease
MKNLTILLFLALSSIPPFTGGQRGVLFAEITVTSDQVTGRPYFLLVKDVDRQQRGAGVPASTAQANAQAFLSQHGYEFGMASLNELKLGRVEKDDLGFTHVRFYQTYNGLPVVFGEMIVHLNTKGEVYAVNGKFARDIFVSTSPAITEEDARNLARVQCQYDFQPMNSPEAKQANLVVLPLGILTPPNPPVNGGEPGDNVHLAWEVSVESADDQPAINGKYYVDAQTGKILKFLDGINRLSRQVYDCNAVPGSTSCYMNRYDATLHYFFGRSEGFSPSGPNPRVGTIYYGSLDVDHLYDLFGAVHNFWQTNFGINGANRQGGLGNDINVPYDKTRGAVHGDDIWSWCPDGADFNYYGYVRFCLGMVTAEVVGHEYTHGVVYYTFLDSTGHGIGAAYTGETGALMESNSDLFGEALQNYYTGSFDWLLGTNTHWLGHNMADPPSITNPDLGLPYPDRMCSMNFYCDTLDHSGVHHNSTVPSKAAYLLSDGGQFNGCYIQPIGFTAVQQLNFRAWTTYFTRTETFNEAVTGFQQACVDLYPDSLATVTTALQAVEMDQAGYCSSVPERAPYSAVHSAGTVSCDSVAFLGSQVVVSGTGGYADREVTFYLAPHPADETIWAAIPIYRAVQAVDTIESDGTLLASVWLADTLGEFDLVVDENSDGFYQPWADTILTMQVLNGAVQDLAAQYVEPDRIRLVWFPLAGANHYAIEADSTGEFTQPSVIATVADTSFIDSVSVPIKELRFYRVRAVW